MALIVVKFGGTSMGTPERIKQAAERVIALQKKGYEVAVVVSAMSGQTDNLIALAKTIVDNPAPREYAALVATGEQVSAALLAMYLIARGYPARSYTADQIQIVTDDNYKSARIQKIETEVLTACIASKMIPIIAGFQGVDEEGNVTTLGRGGSDTTAVAIAAAMQAEECQIYTDVDGVYSCDPRIVPEARLIKQITFDEMLELASLGAKVLQKRSVEFAGKYKVKLRVLSSFVEGEGTLITFEENAMEQPLISGIAFNRNEAKLSLCGLPNTVGIAAQVLQPLSQAEIDIDMIVQHSSTNGSTDFTFTVSRDDYLRSFALIELLAQELNAKEIHGDQKIVKISLVGIGIRSHAGVASKMFSLLAEAGIPIQLIATSEIKISVIIDEKYLEIAVKKLHDGFNLHQVIKEELIV